MIEIIKEGAAYQVNAVDGKAYGAGWIVFCRHAKRWEYRSDDEAYFTADDLIELGEHIKELNDGVIYE